MNFDITVCTGEYCDRKDRCYRFYAFRQLQEIPLESNLVDRRRGVAHMRKANDGKKCDMFWSRKE